MSLSPLRSIIYCSIGLLLAVSVFQLSAQIANSWSVAIAQQPRSVTQKKTCPLTKSIYRAIGNPEFELMFGASKSGIASEFASLTLKHKTRGSITTYNLGESTGYGSFYLATTQPKANDESDEKLMPYFFDRNWKSIKVMGTSKNRKI
jgi:hypothetical protein